MPGRARDAAIVAGAETNEVIQSPFRPGAG